MEPLLDEYIDTEGIKRVSQPHSSPYKNKNLMHPGAPQPDQESAPHILDTNGVNEYTPHGQPENYVDQSESQ